MNRTNVHEYLPLVQALVDGKTLQYSKKTTSGQEWSDYENDDEFSFTSPPESYRIKPEPRTFEMWLTPTGCMHTLLSNQFNIPWKISDCERITVQEVLK